MKKTPVIVCAALMAACTSRPVIDYDAAKNLRTASVLTLTGDTTFVVLTDFLPAFGEVDSVTSESLSIIPIDSGWAELKAIKNPTTAQIGSIGVWHGGMATDIAYRIENENSFKSLYTVGYDGKSIRLGFDSHPQSVVAMWQNRRLPDTAIKISDDAVTITLPKGTEEMERSFIRVFASDGASQYSDVLVPLRNGRVVSSTAELTRHDMHAQVIYSLMIDRFANGNPDNDRRLNRPDVLPVVDYMGGDIAGITRKINEGFFNDMGFSTIWISPITQNPYDAWGLNKTPLTRFSGYHGYWPIYITRLDERFGTDEELREMLDAAHKHGLNVILDYVANHLHINSPTLKDHPDWTTPLYLPDGRKNLELWDEQRLTTWFDEHIPTLDMEREEIYQAMTDSALHWIKNFDFDGFRHDATKHIPEVYWRTLTSKMRERFPERSLYQIGETYGSPQLIGSYVRSGMLDAQFDFNVYDRATWNIVSDSGSLAAIGRELDNSLRTYGYHNLMGYITGNHDRPRFISIAGGSLSFEEDSKHAGWTRDVTVGDASVSYARLAMLEALMMTIPGIPVVYQGDEFGVPGGNDPDNRRMMQFDGYGEQENALRETVKKLTALRHSNMPLIYGNYIPLSSDDKTMAFARVYMGEAAVALFNNSREPRTITITLPASINTGGLSPNFGSEMSAEGRTMTVTLAPLSFEILTR